MDAMTLTQKHLQERIDLENLQKSELEKLDTRHKMQALEAKGKYFETKRQEQRQLLQDEHKKEQSQLFIMHESEWKKFLHVKQIIRESQKTSREQIPKKEREQKPEPEKDTLVAKVRNFLNKIKNKDRGRDM